MGYTHYYYTKPIFPEIKFVKVFKDFQKMIEPLSHLGVKLASWNGSGNPTITESEISFNGIEKCGHTERDLGITWPAKSAHGVSQNKVGQQLEELVKGKWFAGASLETRVCGGDCSHESFILRQKTELDDYKKSLMKRDNTELSFNFTKTAYKPYDLAVNVVLIIASHHLDKSIKVSSDGEMDNWIEGMQLCQHFLGYGNDFELSDD